MTTRADTEPNVARNALVVVAGLAMLGALFGFKNTVSGWVQRPPPSASAAPAQASSAAAERARPPRRAPLELSAEQRAKGFNECSMPDPGDGYFAHSRPMGMGGLVYVPRAGGRTPDGGYDVIVHFHGLGAVKKSVVQKARGVVLAGLDLGNGTTVYNEAFRYAPAFGQLRENIEKALREQSGDPSAHIRHIGLSAWSAGYAAVNAILAREGPSVADAVILLDGLHAGYRNGAKGTSLDDVDAQPLAPTFDFARRALAGEKLFYFSHSSIETDGYASTTKLSSILLDELGLREKAAAPDDDPLALLSYVDQAGFHLRGFDGKDERAHCDHTRNLGEALRDIVEPAWGTPPAE